MPNKFYIKGKNKEQKIVREAREQGLIAFRSAGSHSPIDVCIIDLEARRIEFIQSKHETISQAAKLRLEASLNELNNLFLCTFRVV